MFDKYCTIVQFWILLKDLIFYLAVYLAFLLWANYY